MTRSFCVEVTGMFILIKEHVVLCLECREPVMTDLGSAVTRPKFKLWEVKDILYMLPLERAQAETVPCDVVLEALHKMAYRSV